MRQQNQKARWNNERCFPQAKQSIQKGEMFFIINEQHTESMKYRSSNMTLNAG